MWADKIVLVTGGAGAIGSNLTRALSNKCKKLIVIDDLSSGHYENIEDISDCTFIQGDITEDKHLKQCFNEQIDIVFHLAALYANQNSVEHPQRDLAVNAMGTLKLLQYSQQAGVDRFIYASSSCVYGNNSAAELDLQTPYAISKMTGEHYATFFNKHYGLKTVILRYFNSYGPYEFPGKYRGVIPKFLYNAIKGEPLTITGTGFETRDFTYVEDVVSATIAAAEKETAIGQAFDIGTGKETKIIDLAEEVKKIVNREVKIQFVPRRKWDNILRRRANVHRTHEILGFRATVQISEGLKHTYDWMKRNLGIFTLLPNFSN